MGTVDLAALLTGTETARAVGVSEAMVRRWVRSGRLPAIETKLGRLYRPEDVARFQRERAARRPTPAGNAG